MALLWAPVKCEPVVKDAQDDDSIADVGVWGAWLPQSETLPYSSQHLISVIFTTKN